MNLPLFIARKYFFSRKISAVIHIIAAISMIGITVSTFALIAILSTFNGFEEVVSRLYNTFDSDVKVTPVSGKYFSLDSSKIEQIKKIDGVSAVTPVIEENALIRFREKETAATIKGIDPEFLKTTGIDTLVYLGDPYLQADDHSFALLGAGVASKLAAPGFDDDYPLRIYVARKGNHSLEKAFNIRSIFGGGIFSVQQEFDSRYILVPLDFARDMLDEDERMTAFEINTVSDEAAEEVKGEIALIVGSKFKVQDRFQQQPMMYKVMKSEKLMVYLILSFVLLIAAFTLIGALLMLAIEKQQDMATLLSMGATPRLIRNIIFAEGLILSLGGAIFGMLTGFVICWLQMKFGFLKIAEGSTFVIKAYPIAFDIRDFILVFITVIVMGFFASWYPAYTAHRKLNVALLKSRE
jgi:lipoprotein-releasing system permease protein